MAYFGYAVRYDVMATCLSPLRTGSSGHSVDEVLHLEDGTYMVQASSLAGVLRQYIAHHMPGKEKLLFGAANQEQLEKRSPVEVTDGLFLPETVLISRPRVRVDSHTGAAQDQKFFHMAAVDTGACFAFSLILRTENQEQELEQILESALSALDGGDIILGAQQTNGFGRVSLKVRRTRFDMKQKEGRCAWLEDQGDGEELSLRMQRTNALFSLTGKMDSIFVRSGRRMKKGKIQSVAIAMEDQSGKLIPGSSIKGCLRNRAAAIGDWLGCNEVVERLFGREAHGKQDTGWAGKLRVCECRLPESKYYYINPQPVAFYSVGGWQIPQGS